MTESAVGALQRITRDLLGLAVRSVDDVGEVSLPQMRLLLTIRDEGRVSCSRLAQVLGINASSVTRLADRLVESGHVVRCQGASRVVVQLELTPHGQKVVDAVLAWRSRELQEVLGRLDAEALRSLTASLDQLHDGLERRHHDLDGPVPL